MILTDDYKRAFLKLAEKHNITLSQFATWAGVQKSFISSCLNGPKHLSEEQAWAIAKALELPSSDIQILLLMLRRDKARNVSYKATLQQQITELRSLANQLGEQAKRDSFDDLGFYYLDTNYQLLHMLLMIPRFAQMPALLSQVLDVSADSLAMMLCKLEGVQLIAKSHKGGWVVRTETVISNKHPLAQHMHALWRIRALETPFRLAESDYRYTATFVGDKRSYERLLADMKSLIVEHSKAMVHAKNEDVFHLNLDLWRIV